MTPTPAQSTAAHLAAIWSLSDTCPQARAVMAAVIGQIETDKRRRVIDGQTLRIIA
jgi:hypothetical protein